MGFTDRERFIQMMTVMITSETAKKIPRDARQSILNYLRKKHCPSVTDEMWHEIAEGINHNQKMIIGSMIKNTELSMSVDAGEIQNDPALTTLDREFRENFKDISDEQWKELESSCKKLGFGDLFDKVFKMKKDYDGGK
jgi:hypothetical protein